MWKCPNCGRIFTKNGQTHSCRKVALDDHFKNKKYAKYLFDYLLETIVKNVGECEIISLPCCIHLFGNFDFIAILPKKDGIEIRFSLDRIIDSPRLGQSVKVSDSSYKNCFDIKSIAEIDEELVGWLKEAYRLKSK